MLDWRQLLGLLQMPLDGDGHHYILLNGQDGNFCCSDVGIDEQLARNIAWSTDVGHYLTFENDIVTDFDWLNKEPRRLNRRDIENDVEGFYAQLRQKRGGRGASVIA